MLADDRGEGVRNHTFPYITIILRGGYWKHLVQVNFGDHQGTLVLDRPITPSES